MSAPAPTHAAASFQPVAVVSALRLSGLINDVLVLRGGGVVI